MRGQTGRGSGGVCLNADEPRLKRFNKVERLIAPQATSNNGLPVCIDDVDIEDMLGDIQADRDILRLGWTPRV